MIKFILTTLLFLPLYSYAGSKIQTIRCRNYMSAFPNAPVAVDSLTVKLNEPVDAFEGYELYGLKANVQISLTDKYAKQVGAKSKDYRFTGNGAKKETPKYSNEIAVLSEGLDIRLYPVKETSEGVEYTGTANIQKDGLDLWLSERFGERPLKCIAR